MAEVWIWRTNKIVVHALCGDQYEIANRSALLPDLDLDVLAGYLEYPSQSQAARAYRERLRGQRGERDLIQRSDS